MNPPAGNGVFITRTAQLTPERPLLLKFKYNKKFKTLNDVILVNCPAANPHLPLEKVSHTLDSVKMFPIERNISLADFIDREHMKLSTCDRRQENYFRKYATLEMRRNDSNEQRKRQYLHLQTIKAKMRVITETISSTVIQILSCKKVITIADKRARLAKATAMEAQAALLSIKVDCFTTPGIDFLELHQTIAITNETTHGQIIESIMKWREANADKEMKEMHLKELREAEEMLEKMLEEQTAEKDRIKLVVEEETKKLMELKKICKQYDIQGAVKEPPPQLQGPKLRKRRQEQQKQQQQQAPLQRRQRQPRRRQPRQP